MKATELIAASLEMSKGWIMGLIADMQDAPTMFPTPNGGNHPLWVLGHLTYSEANLIDVFVKGQANSVADWKGMFDQGTQPLADAGRYPPFDEVMAKFEEVRGRTLATLSSLTDEDLDKPSHCPDDMKQLFGTVGQCLIALVVHFGYHGGQVADARRAAGRQPLMG